MLRNYYFFRVLIILLSFYLTNSVYSQDNLIKDSIDPYCQANDVDEFFQDKKIKNIKGLMSFHLPIFKKESPFLQGGEYVTLK